MIRIYQIVGIMLFLVLIFNCKSQKICQNCWNDNHTFLCNGLNCQAFYKNPQNSYCSYGNIVCKGGAIICYQSSKNNSNLCVACNFTDPACYSCSTTYNQTNHKCSACIDGYYRYQDLQKQETVCKSCATSIPGCQICKIQSQCQQCKAEYRNINKLCYNQDGTIVNGSSVPGGWTGQGIFTIILLFVLIGLNGFQIFINRKKSKKNSLLSQNN